MVDAITLTNDDRRHLGLPPLDSAWDEVTLGSVTLYLDGDRIHRRILRDGVHWGAPYAEAEVDRQLDPAREWILPATSKGKPVRLTEATATSRIGPSGITVVLGDNPEIINSRTGHAFPTKDPEVPDAVDLGVRNWLEAWKRATTTADLADLDAFAAAQRRQRVRYREGDVFAFRHTRREWGFGRVLWDRAAAAAAGEFPADQFHGYGLFLGRVVLIQVFRALADTPEVNVSDLVGTPTLPSAMVMDDGLLRGEWPIIGHAPVDPAEVDHLLMVGKSLHFDDDTWYVQQGLRFETLPEVTLFGQMPDDVVETLEWTSFAVGSSGPSLPVGALRACVAAGSNEPYWEENPRDLRSPAHRRIRELLLDAFDA